MIFGIVGHSSSTTEIPGLQPTADDASAFLTSLIDLFTNGQKAGRTQYSAIASDAAGVMLPTGVPSIDANLSAHREPQSGSFAIVHGNLYNRPELAAEYLPRGSRSRAATNAEVVLKMMQQEGEKSFG